MGFKVRTEMGYDPFISSEGQPGIVFPQHITLYDAEISYPCAGFPNPSMKKLLIRIELLLIIRNNSGSEANEDLERVVIISFNTQEDIFRCVEKV